MSFPSLQSSGASQDQNALPVPEDRGPHEILRVTAQLQADDHQAAAQICRTALLDWAASEIGGALPTEAAAHGAFSLVRGRRECEGVRASRPGLDLWFVRLRHPDPGDSGLFRITEAGCETPDGGPPLVRIRQALEGGPVSPELEPRVPEVLAQLAARVPLRQFGVPISPEPWLVDSEAAVARLFKTLTDTARQRPVIVLSVSNKASDPNQPLLDPGLLARDTFGLAEVVVLPAAHTWELSRRLGNPRLGVVQGAVRIYAPGFRLDSNGKAHLRIPRARFQSPESAGRHRARIQRWIAKDSLRSQPAGSLGPFRAPAPGAAPVRGRATSTHARPPQPPPEPRRQEAPRAASPDRPRRPAPAASAPKAAARPAPRKSAKKPAPATGAPRTPPRSAPAKANTPDTRPAPRPEPAGWLGNRLRLLARLFSPARDPWADDPVRQRLQREKAALETRLQKADAARARLDGRVAKSNEEKDYYLAEYEKAQARALEAERQGRDAERRMRRIEALRAQLRRRGHVPAPDDWKDLAAWCREEFADEIELRPGAVQGIKKSDFEDLGLAADCIIWLARTYRDYRRTSPGHSLDIQQDVDSRLSDGLAFRSVAFPDWDHVPHHERRNIGRGTSRDRKNCLRIYYYWDADTEKVIIVSMPHHAEA